MAYIEVTTIVDGALDSVDVIFDDLILADTIAQIEADARDHGYPTQVFLEYHDHDYDVCECAQYAQDRHPTYTYNESAA